MHDATHPTRTQGTLRPRRLKLYVALTLALTMYATTSWAQWAVVDAGNIANNKLGFATQLAKTVEQYQKQIQQYTTQLQQYSQMLSSIKGLNIGMSLTPNQLTPISDPNSLVQANCAGGSSGGLLGSVLNSLGSIANQSITQSQQQICAKIVLTKIDKYNKTVDMLDQVNKYSNTFQQVQQTGQSIDTMADSGRANNQAQVYSSALNTQMANWQAQMQADDAIIRTLEDQQSMLANIALNGGNGSMLDSALPNVTFQTAISNIQ
ncbi:hypothetical protein [Dyella sp. A6]|uniref:hypothetical protein n=1 Tax=Dyella aluminiiresistens TaxID=3069105 RepID=UPI002E7A5CBD|nr:hypothetical protein [Dyella sp. A6]